MQIIKVEPKNELLIRNSKMTKAELRINLIDSSLFSDKEIGLLLHTMGAYTIGNAIIACELIGIELHGSDIDALIATLDD